MRTRFFHVGLGALLLGAGLFCLGDRDSIAAVALPVLAHELGHLLALWILGMPVRGFRLELRGFCIEYGGSSGAVGHALPGLWPALSTRSAPPVWPRSLEATGSP